MNPVYYLFSYPTCTQQLEDTKEQLALTQQSKESLVNKDKGFVVTAKKIFQTF